MNIHPIIALSLRHWAPADSPVQQAAEEAAARMDANADAYMQREAERALELQQNWLAATGQLEGLT